MTEPIEAWEPERRRRLLAIAIIGVLVATCLLAVASHYRARWNDISLQIIDTLRAHARARNH